jgi:hypothetical protein
MGTFRASSVRAEEYYQLVAHPYSRRTPKSVSIWSIRTWSICCAVSSIACDKCELVRDPSFPFIRVAYFPIPIVSKNQSNSYNVQFAPRVHAAGRQHLEALPLIVRSTRTRLSRLPIKRRTRLSQTSRFIPQILSQT